MRPLDKAQLQGISPLTFPLLYKVHCTLIYKISEDIEIKEVTPFPTGITMGELTVASRFFEVVVSEDRFECCVVRMASLGPTGRLNENIRNHKAYPLVQKVVRALLLQLQAYQKAS